MSLRSIFAMADADVANKHYCSKHFNLESETVHSEHRQAKFLHTVKRLTAGILNIITLETLLD